MPTFEERYSRQIRFAPIGLEGQNKLQEKHVCVIGMGALGTNCAELLTRAGIGKLTLIDRDYVDWSNLHRQHLFTEDDVTQMMPKAIAAKKHLQQINRDIEIYAYVEEWNLQTAHQFIQQIDLIIDATDNFPARELINDLSCQHRIPWIYGGCVGSTGITLPIIPGKTPCLRCLADQLPTNGATCDTLGVIPTVVTMVASYQVTEAIKILINDYSSIQSKLITFDLWQNHHLRLDLSHTKKLNCPSCGEHPSFPALQDQSPIQHQTLCGRNTVQIRPLQRTSRSLLELGHLLKRFGEVRGNEHLLSILIPSGHRVVLFPDGRTLVHGTDDIQEARKIVETLLG